MIQCNYPECKHSYASIDAVRKHAKKRHVVWIEDKKPKDYCILISDGADTIDSFNDIIPILISENDIIYYLNKYSV